MSHVQARPFSFFGQKHTSKTLTSQTCAKVLPANPFGFTLKLAIEVEDGERCTVMFVFNCHLFHLQLG
jgi:hypothetical protein